jgi:hypothetical protein
MEHSTAANPPPKAHARKAQRRRVCGSATVLCHQKKRTVHWLNKRNKKTKYIIMHKDKIQHSKYISYIYNINI